MNNQEIMVLNDLFNVWYEQQLQFFVASHPEIKKQPELWKNLKFDLHQAKVDAVRKTEETVVKYECPSRLQTTADVLCMGRTTVHDLLKMEY